MQEIWVQSLGWEDPLEKGMATHSSISAWRIPMDRGAWLTTVHGVAKSQRQLSNKHFHFLFFIIMKRFHYIFWNEKGKLQNTMCVLLSFCVRKYLYACIYAYGGGHGNHSSIPAWRIPWTEELSGLQATGPQRVGHNWHDLAQHTYMCIHINMYIHIHFGEPV